ncbi:hypothetical protein LZ32DRAFT_27069 [Colletotrichum eremochloae]|nr:hypothetical protein LZ32DRAFT_27069 [Colletotrichum eremochloae]
MYFVFNLGVFLYHLGVGFFWTLASFYTTRLYRPSYFDPMLWQDVSFFDIKGHGASEMTSRLSMHPQKLQNLLSTIRALINVSFVDPVSCFMLAVAMGWRLGLHGDNCRRNAHPIWRSFLSPTPRMANEDRLIQMCLECAGFASEAAGAVKSGLGKQRAGRLPGLHRGVFKQEALQ